MARKTTHTCERCGHETQQHYAGSFRDSDYIELLHELLEMEQRAKHAECQERYWMARYETLRERSEQLREIVAEDYPAVPF